MKDSYQENIGGHRSLCVKLERFTQGRAALTQADPRVVSSRDY